MTTKESKVEKDAVNSIDRFTNDQTQGSRYTKENNEVAKRSEPLERKSLRRKKPYLL